MSNTSLAILDQAVVSGTRFLTTITVGRLCGQEELGIYSLTFAIYLIFACTQEALITAPYTVFGNRLKGDPKRSLAGSVLAHCFILSFSAALAISGGTFLLWAGEGYSDLIRAAFTLATVLPFLLLWEFARRYAIAHLNLRHALVLDVATSILQIAGLAWLAWKDDLSFVGAFLALGLGCLCTGVASFLYYRNEFQFSRPQVLFNWWKHWRFGRWILGGQIIGLLHSYSPAWVLVFAVGTAATGVYSACATIVLLSNPLILAIANLVAATTAHAYADGGYPAVRQVVQHASLYCAGAMGLLWLILFFAGDLAVTMLYGEEFRGNGHVVSAIALAAPLWAVSCVISAGLRTVERPDYDFRSRVAGLLITFVLCLLTVSHFGVVGMAYALVAGSAVSTLWQAWAFYLSVPSLR